VSHLKTGDSEVLQLVWQERVNESEGIVFFPNCSLVQGRNRLFEEMLRRYADTEFEYAVFMDDDVELEELLDYGINTGNAWRTFERYLTQWRPAVGLPVHKCFQGRLVAGQEAQAVYNLDHLIVVAYQRETWPIFLPYTEVFERMESWWYCSTVQRLVSAAFFNTYRIQFNAVRLSSVAVGGAEEELEQSADDCEMAFFWQTRCKEKSNISHLVHYLCAQQLATHTPSSSQSTFPHEFKNIAIQ
jgi:hypothetical protein